VEREVKGKKIKEKKLGESEFFPLVWIEQEIQEFV